LSFFRLYKKYIERLRNNNIVEILLFYKMIYRDKDGKCLEIHKNNHDNDLDYMKEILKVFNIKIKNNRQDKPVKSLIKTNIFTNGGVNREESKIKKFLRENNIIAIRD